MTDREPILPPQTQLAVERTRLGQERTLMAWIRTAASLITFGFTIYKLFQYLQDVEAPVAARLIGPRELGLLFIGVGALSLIVATLEHGRERRRLRAKYGEIPFSLSSVVAWLVSGLGILALVAVLLRQ